MTNTPLPVQLRPMDEADFSRIAEIMSMFTSELITPEELARQYQMAHPETIRQWMVALDEHGCLVGVSRTAHSPWMPSANSG